MKKNKPVRRSIRLRQVHPAADPEKAETALRDLPAAGARRNASPAGRRARAAQTDTVKWAAPPELQAFYSMVCAITTDLDFPSVVRQILNAAVGTLGAERGIVFLGRGDGAGLVPALSTNIQGEELLVVENLVRTVLGSVQRGEVVATQDAAADPRFRAVESARLKAARSVLCTSLLGPSGSVGALYLDASTPLAFHNEAETIFKAFADVAARALENARVHGELLQENIRLRHQPAAAEPVQRFMGASAVAEALRRRAKIIALMDGPALIRGERGTGKECVARAIHDASTRGPKPFVSCDCSMIPAEALKGLIFGRTGVASTGSHTEETGLLARADRGTLYLESADLLPVDLGRELADILDRGSYRAMGARRDLRLDVRLILGTSKDLDEEVRRGRFSAALLSKVRRLALLMPTLRERKEDISELSGHFLRLHGDGAAGGRGVTLTNDAAELLEGQPWPGNVEELSDVIRRSILLTRKSVVDADTVQRALLPIQEDEARVQGPWSGLILPLDDWEKEAIRQTLSQVRGNKAKAARLLGIHRNTLVRKLAAWNM